MAYIGNSPANVGNYQVVDDIASSFNGTTTSFALTSLSQAINPAKSGQLLVSINGVLQEPDDTGADGFKVSGSNIVFSSAPASGSTFWCVYQGANVDIGTPSDGTVGTAQMSSAELELSGGLDVTGSVTCDGLTVKPSSGSLTTRIEGATNNDSSKLYVSNISSGDGGIKYNAASNEMDIFSYSTLRFNVGTANISGAIGNERLRILPSGGITFNGDTAAANALDDYEEGTWTPTVVSDTGGTGTLLTSGPSTYTKIGRTVFFQAYVYSINLSAITSGKVQFDGLPFSGSGYSAISPTYNNTNATGLFASSGTKLRVEKDGTYLYYNTFTGNKMMIAGVYTTA
jgi:hypothetical protein